MSKFKVGDTVRAIENDTFGEWHVGDVMQVVCGVNQYAGLPCVGNERSINHEANVEEFELVEFAAPAIDAHYTKYAIQPMEFSLANGLDAAQHTVIKYTVRYRDKGGIRDLRAAIRVLELMIEREEKAQANG